MLKNKSRFLQSQNLTNLQPVIIAFFLSLVGLAFIFESSSVVAFENYQNSFYFFNRQLLWLIIASFTYFIISKIPFLFWKKYSFLFLVGGLLAMIVVLIPQIGIKVGGARRWIDLGPFSFQPSEIMKLVSLIYLSSHLESKRIEKSHLFFFWGASFLTIYFTSLSMTLKIVGSIIIFGSIFFVAQLNSDKIKLAGFCYLFSLIFFLTMSQPDMGTAISLLLLLIGTYYISEHHTTEIVFFLISGVVLAAFLILSSPYRMERIIGFLNPKADTLGTTYHIHQILIGVSSGGLFGRGLFQSRQKYEFLPEAHTDSIFAIIAEELGVIGSIMIMGMFFVLLKQLKSTITNINDKTEKLFVSGVFLLIAIQVSINLAGMTNLLPLTGIPLPFLSYGGTSLLTFAIMLGIIQSIKSNQN